MRNEVRVIYLLYTTQFIHSDAILYPVLTWQLNLCKKKKLCVQKISKSINNYIKRIIYENEILEVCAAKFDKVVM